MLFSCKILAVLSLARFAGAQSEEDRPLPDKDFCAKPRCITLSLKDQSDTSLFSVPAAPANAVNFVEKTPAGNELEFSYTKYFDHQFLAPVLCNVCVKTTTASSTLVTTLNTPFAYLRASESCKPAASQAEKPTGMTYTRADVDKDITFENVPEFRVIPAAFFQDQKKDKVGAGDYPDNYCINTYQDYVDPCCFDSSAPSAKPTTAKPTTAAPTTPAPKKNPCFSSVATVEVKGKGLRNIKALNVGDMVLTPNGYEKVYTIDHRHETKATKFVQIFTELDKALELTSEHLIFLNGRNDPVEARSIKIGDELVSFTGTKSRVVKVTQVSSVTRDGLYNPITSSGTIVVDGIATSTYTAVDLTGGSNYLTISGYKLLSMHDFLHLAMGPFRSLCVNSPSRVSSYVCSIKQGDEHNFYNKIGLQVLSFGRGVSPFMQSLMVISLICLFVGFKIASNPFVLIASIVCLKCQMKTKNC
jgi:hypothetical protein